MKRKLLSLLLTFCILCTACPISALAASNDITAPVVTGVSMNAPGATVKPGDTLYFNVNVEDESDISSVYLDLRHSENTSHSMTARLASYNEDTGVAQLTLTIPKNKINGTWELYSIDVHDYYGNYKSYYGDGHYNDANIPGFDDVCFTVGNTSDDITAPVVTSVSMNTPGATVKPGDTLYFNVNVEDESEISSVYLDLRHSENTSHSMTARLASYNEDTGVAQLTLTIPKNKINGTWELYSIDVHDYYGNYKSYYGDGHYNDANIPGFHDIRFTIENTSDDTTAPIVTSVSMNTPGVTVTTGDILSFTVNVGDNSNLSSVYLDLRHSENTSHSMTARLASYNEDTGVAQLTLTIPKNKINGTWELYSIDVHDYYGNYKSYYGDGHYNDANIPGFDDIHFTIASIDTLPTAVTIPEKIEVSVCDVYTIRPDVEPITSIPNWTWTSSDTSIAEIYSIDSFRAANIIGVAPGIATITGVTSNGLTVSSEVTVLDAPPPTAGQIDSVYSIDVDATITILPGLTPADATTLYEVTSDNPHVAMAGTTDGQTAVTITGINPGTATITIRGRNNLLMTTTVIVGDENDIQHKKVVVEGWEATCTLEGRTSYTRCSACYYHFTEPEAIPATGHEFGEWYVDREPTETREGLSRRKCQRCWVSETKPIPATGTSGTPDIPDTPVIPEKPDIPDTPVVPEKPDTPNVPEIPDYPDEPGYSDLPVTNHKPTVNIGSEKVDANVKGNHAEITVSNDNITNMIGDAANTGVVKLNVSGLKDVSHLSVPQNLIGAINESNDVSALSITMNSGSMEISADALSTIASALESENDSVKFEINTVDAADIPGTQRYPISNVMNSAVFVNLNATIEHKDDKGNITGTEQIHEFYGNISVSVPFQQPENMEGRQIIACYFADDGSITYFPAKYENGIVTFTTNHYSAFGVFASSAAAFSDIDLNAWYMTAVEYAANNQLMNGVSNTSFAPNNALSRAMLAQILYNKADQPVIEESSAFTDVTADDWFADAVIWAASEEIVGGYGNGLFGANDNITREQLVVMLWRSVGSPEPTESGSTLLDNYTDSTKISGYAEQAMVWAVSNGIINGMGDDILNPGGNATRAQVAQMLMKFMTI